VFAVPRSMAMSWPAKAKRDSATKGPLRELPGGSVLLVAVLQPCGVRNGADQSSTEEDLK